MSELKEGFPNDLNNNEAPQNNGAVESSAEETEKKPKEERIITFGDYNLKIKIPEEKQEKK